LEKVRQQKSSIANNILYVMEEKEMTEFAKILVNNIRDMAIQSADVQLHATNSNSPTAKRWQSSKNDMIKFGEMTIADSVDTAIFYFLLAVDEGVLNVSINTPDGEVLDIPKDRIGELGGWYIGEWIEKHTKERFYDDLSGI
jgi:hypothetical protein